MRKVLTVMVAGCLALGGPVWAKGPKAGGGGGGCGKGKGGQVQAFKKEQKSERKEFRAGQKSERQEFKKSLEGKSPEERKKAMQEFNQRQRAERQAFHAQRRAENLAFLRERLAQNPKLSEDQRKQILAAFEASQNEWTGFGKKYQERITAFMEKLGTDQSMTPEQCQAAIKDFFAGLQKEREAERAKKQQEPSASPDASTPSSAPEGSAPATPTPAGDDGADDD